MTPQPNSKDHPELIEAMKKCNQATLDYTNFKRDHPDLTEENKQALDQLQQAIVDTTKDVIQWCQHYGINYGSLDFKQLD